MVEMKETFDKSLNKLLSELCKDNKDFIKKFFKEQKIKLKRINELSELDDGCYKTLLGYISKFRNLNIWFDKKPWKNITKVRLTKFYNDFEDGKIVGVKGKPVMDRRKYYTQIFKSTPFEMLGKLKMAKEVMKYRTNRKEEVRFIEKKTVDKLISVAMKPQHKGLIALGFDVGENVNSLLLLKKKDFVRQVDNDTGIAEYRVNLHKDILKRSRTARGELTNYDETVKLLDIILADLKDDDLVFPFKYRNAKKILDRAVDLVGAKCIPNGQKVTWKDLRSSMACDLLSKDWSRDEINRRLGHRPSSAEIDKYINFLSIDGKKPQRKVYEHNLAKIQSELEKSKERERLQTMRVETMKADIDELRKLFMALKK